VVGQFLLCQFLELSHLSFDVIVLSEIWSNRPNVTFYCNIIPGYTFYYDLPTTPIHQEINMFKLDTTQSVPCTWEYLDWNYETVQRYIIAGLYLHPKKSIREFCNKLDAVLHRIASQKVPCIVAGDFNHCALT